MGAEPVTYVTGSAPGQRPFATCPPHSLSLPWFPVCTLPIEQNKITKERQECQNVSKVTEFIKLSLSIWKTGKKEKRKLVSFFIHKALSTKSYHIASDNTVSVLIKIYYITFSRCFYSK